MIRIGMIGLSEGNGHPFSFSAIINGYDRASFDAANWPVILNYLEQQPRENFGVENARITHAWTQDNALTDQLCAACNIPNAVNHIDEMFGEIDALIVARDDWECHAEIAMPFLENGIPVFIDKPLTLDKVELNKFRPFLENGMLMSTSGLRYAKELDEIKKQFPELGSVRLVSATVLNNIDKYGIHMLDAINGLGLPNPIAILRLPANHESFQLTLADGSTMILNCLGRVGKTFHLSIFADNGHMHIDLHDNFTAFRRTLQHFAEMLKTHKPPISPAQIAGTMSLIRTAKNLAPGQTAEIIYA